MSAFVSFSYSVYITLMQSGMHALSLGMFVWLNVDNLLQKVSLGRDELSGSVYAWEKRYNKLKLITFISCLNNKCKSSLSSKTVGFTPPVTCQCTEWSPGKQEVMIHTLGARQQRPSGTKEQNTNMKLMSKAPGFCLWSCIGVISEEGPCPCISLLSTPSYPRWGLALGEAGQLSWGEWKEWLCRVCPKGGGARSEVIAGLWPDDRGSCDAKRLFWLYDWDSLPNPYYMQKGPAD